MVRFFGPPCMYVARERQTDGRTDVQAATFNAPSRVGHITKFEIYELTSFHLLHAQVQLI